MKMETKNQKAFTLMEVMVATGIFFMAVFAILALVSSSLEHARRMQRPMVDAGIPAGELSLTNKLVEGEQSGDFGQTYPGYSWAAKITEVQTNRLFQVDYQVLNGNREVIQKMSVQFFRPLSPAGSMDGATVIR